MIDYISYERVNDLYFNDSSEKAIQVFGEPELKSKSHSDKVEFYYSVSKKNDYDFAIIFDEDDKFSEFILYPHTKARINGIVIEWELDKILNIINLDNNPRMDDYGITLYDLGIAFGSFKETDSLSEKSINLFRKGIFDDFQEDTNSFHINEYI